MSIQEQCEKLSSTLRGATTRAAELAGGGCALLVSSMPGNNTRDARLQLRAAAGFADERAAEQATAALSTATDEALAGADTMRVPAHPSLGERGKGGVTVHPLSCDGRINGALIVGYPDAPSQATFQQIAQLADSASIHLDHALISSELVELRKKLCESQDGDDDQTDEMLKLSEALFAQDIELLRNNEKLGKIEKLKNDFIEKMSRELRTPLNSIIESIISVLAGENESISESAKASMRGALDEGTAFQRTLENILDLWRIKQGELPIVIQEVSFPEMVEETIFSVQDTVANKPVTINREIDGAMPVFKADLAKLNQILFLLFDNAAKFTEKGEITIRGRMNESTLECEVLDSGIGICADDQEFIFDEFYQVDEGLSAKYRGAGLGLTLVRDLLVLLDGDIKLESEAGRGTHVRLRIPVQLGD
ncbi:MAG: HAMP domain-containing histidine kinase [Deltaproteobacteria bacterium]|nr:HAMP domain-containing histidine kinase [Deltaproteobacteria bacterium]MBW2291684.1 HAMP domain-containing histidine kinase [Deltaproteobacteria bacterium]MBW2724616.1 HAMP domain-containing histidine kinase [Deltaproteobacteria bacterium]